MTDPIRIALLEDDAALLESYQQRLSAAPHIVVAGAVSTGAELEALLAAQPVDVALLDLAVPAGPENPAPYPLLTALPRLLQAYPALHALVIARHTDRSLIGAVLETGVSGYLLKDDAATLEALAAVVTTVARGGLVFSANAFHSLPRRGPRTGPRLTARQQEALALSAAYPDAPLAELAQRLGVMNSTARNLLSGAYLRLGVRNRASAVTRARQLGLIAANGLNGLPEAAWSAAPEGLS
jgi:DNA-binding NarL/FixJ family response regulator